MTTSGSGNGPASETGREDRPHPAPEVEQTGNEPSQYLIIVPADMEDAIFGALGRQHHGASRIYDLAVVTSDRHGSTIRTGIYARDYATAINEYLREWGVGPEIDETRIDGWTPRQMRALLTMSAYQFHFDWTARRVTWCRARSMGIEWTDVLSHYRDIPTGNPAPTDDQPGN